MRHVTLTCAAFLVVCFLARQGAAAEAATPRGAPAPPAATQPQQAGRWEATIESIGDDRSSLVVRYQKLSVALAVTKELQGQLKPFRVGDPIVLEVGQGGALQEVSPVRVPVSRERRFWVLSLSALVVVIFTLVVFWGRARLLVVGQDGRHSNSKYQIVLWFGVLLVTYIATLYFRWAVGGGRLIGGVAIPKNLLLLSGLSALSFAGAKAITASKVSAATAAGGAAAAARAKPRAATSQFPADLLCDDSGRPDLGDFQMLVVTLLALVVYAALVFAFLGSIELLKTVTLPDVDSTILAAFGLGQGAYLAKKYAGDGA